MRFTLDGKTVKTFRKVGSRTVAVRVTPAALSRARHTVRARVTFEPGTGTAAKTLHSSFTLCRVKLIRPRFTG